MLMEQTLHTLKALRLPGMATAFEEQQHHAAMADLSFDERFSLLVDREHTWRENRRLTRLLREAKLKSAQACVEDIRYGNGRKLDKSLMAQLATSQWIHLHQNLVLTGATGCGKTWLACAFGNAACRQGLSVAYAHTPRLFEELRIAHGDGSFGKRLATLAKTDLLILDDWGLAPLNQAERNDLLEVLDDRVGTRATLITSQLPWGRRNIASSQAAEVQILIEESPAITTLAHPAVSSLGGFSNACPSAPSHPESLTRRGRHRITLTHDRSSGIQ